MLDFKIVSLYCQIKELLALVAMYIHSFYFFNHDIARMLECY